MTRYISGIAAAGSPLECILCRCLGFILCDWHQTYSHFLPPARSLLPSTSKVGCAVWNDGCNDCTKDDSGRFTVCTELACLTSGRPVCKRREDGSITTTDVASTSKISTTPMMADGFLTPPPTTSTPMIMDGVWTAPPATSKPVVMDGIRTVPPTTSTPMIMDGIKTVPAATSKPVIMDGVRTAPPITSKPVIMDGVKTVPPTTTVPLMTESVKTAATTRGPLDGSVAAQQAGGSAAGSGAEGTASAAIGTIVGAAVGAAVALVALVALVVVVMARQRKVGWCLVRCARACVTDAPPRGLLLFFPMPLATSPLPPTHHSATYWTRELLYLFEGDSAVS